MNNNMIKAIMKLIQRNENVVILTADNGFLHFDPLREMMPNKFYNFGIAEASMVSFAAGLESCGKVPYVITMATFLIHRAFEQIRNDICVKARNVKMIGVGCGLNYSLLGSSHHAIDDIPAAVALPNMKVLCPCGIGEASKALAYAYQLSGPVYIRFSDSPGYDESGRLFDMGKSVMLKQSDDITLVCTGDILTEVAKAQGMLLEKGYNAGILYIPSLKPFDEEAVINLTQKTKRILTVEEHLLGSGFGVLVQLALSKLPYNGGCLVRHMGIGDAFPDKYGSHEELIDYYKLSAPYIVQNAVDMICGGKSNPIYPDRCKEWISK